MKITVKEFIKKWNINETELRIYVQEMNSEEWRNLNRYYDSEVIDVYMHNGDTVLTVAK